MNNEILNFIIDQFKILITTSVKVLRASKYSVDVKNFPKTHTVKGTVTVGNQGKVEEILKRQEGQLKKLLAIKPKESIRVENLSDIPKTIVNVPQEVTVKNPQKKVTIDNLEKLEKTVLQVLQAVNKLKLDPKITVESPKVTVKAPEVHIPPHPKMPDIKFPEIEELISEDPKKYVPVRLTDGEKFYEAITTFVSSLKRAASSLSTYLADGNNHLVTAQGDFWGLNNSAKSGSTTYLGEESTLGDWKVTKIVASGTSPNKSIEMTYATVKNNSGVTAYADAWTDRASLDYGTFAQAA